MTGRVPTILLLILARLRLGQCGQNLENLLSDLNQLKPVRNCIIFTESFAVQDYVSTFHKFVPLMVINIQESRTGEDYNRTWSKSVETHLSNYYNVYFTFLTNAEHFERSFTTIASMNFWKARQKNVFVGNFSLQQVKMYSKRAYKDYWATNLLFTNYSFEALTRYDPFRKVLLIQKKADIIFLNTAFNLHGTVLTMAMFPSVLARWTGRHFEGRDGNLLLELRKQLNATVKYRHFPAGDYGDIYPNGTCTGTFKEVFEGHSHASLNSRFMARDYFKFVDYTYPHDIHSLVVLLPIRTKADGNLLRVLPLLLHLLGVALLVILDVYLKVFGKTALSKAFLLNIQLLANHPVDLIHVKHYRIWLMALTFYYFYLIADVQAKLTSVLAVTEKEPELTRISEAAGLDYQFNTEEIFRVTLERFEGADKDHVSRILAKNAFYRTKEFAARMTKCLQNEGFLTVGKLAESYTRNVMDEHGYKKECYYKVAQQLNPAQLTYVFRYGTPLLGKVNQVIMDIIEAGLLGFWQRKSSLKHKNPHSPTKITFGNFQFMVKGIGMAWLVAFVVFLYEVAAGGGIKKAPKTLNKCFKLGNIIQGVHDKRNKKMGIFCK